MLRLRSGEILADLPDFLLCFDESLHELILDKLETARIKNERIELELKLDRSKKPGESRLIFTAKPTQLLGESDLTICGILKEASLKNHRSEYASNAMIERMRTSNVELANFASVASHDMREPLRMITSYLRLLQERSPEALDNRARRYIEYACDGADRMRNLIDDLLSYARLDKLDKAFEPLALEDILTASIDNLSASIKESKAEVTVEVDHAPVVMGDKVRLTRLIQNLISNGIKFKKPEQTPRVHVSFKDGNLLSARGKWVVSIKDNGIGIDPDHHNLLFDLFRRLNTRDEYEGSGIGLAVCKKIAEQHGGRIWFDSAAGKGSTFYIALDKAKPDYL